MIRCLGLDEGQQALALLGGSKELESDAASTHRTDHRGHFKREFTVIKGQLKIEDVVRMDLSRALDDTATHREIEHRSLTSDLAPGEREVESHGNPEMFAAIDRMRGMVQPKTGRQKTVTARGTAEWRHEEEAGEVFAWRLRVRPQEAVLLAPRTTQDAAHIICSFLFPCSDGPTSQALSCPRIDDLLLSVKKTKIPCGSRVERNGRFIGEPRCLHVHLRTPLVPPAIPLPRPIGS